MALCSVTLCDLKLISNYHKPPIFHIFIALHIFVVGKVLQIWHWLIVASAIVQHDKRQVTWTICILVGTIHISGTSAATVVEFCTNVCYIKSQRMDEKSPLKVACMVRVTWPTFYLRDAMLARVGLLAVIDSPCVCPSVCLCPSILHTPALCQTG